MLDIEYLKKLYHNNAVTIFFANVSYLTCEPLKNEEDLDRLSNCYQACVSASLMNKTEKLDHFCISILDKADRKKYSVYFRDNDEKQVYFLLNLSKVSYSDFVSILKSSAKLYENSSNKYCCMANLIIDQDGNNYLFNNGSGNGKPRSFERVVHDTKKDLKNKSKFKEKELQLG